MRLYLKILALAAATLLPAAGSAQVLPTPVLVDGTVLEVVSDGKATRAPDLAVINTGVVTQASTAAGALSDNASRVKRVIAALRGAGVADRDIRTANISLQPQYRYAENTPPAITGYQASNTVSVRFRDIARTGAILDSLVREGANQIDGPTLALDKPEAALNDARADAVAKARIRAGFYARLAGLQVDRILSISEKSGTSAPFMAGAMRENMAAADVATKLIPGEQDVTVSLSVRFLLK